MRQLFIVLFLLVSWQIVAQHRVRPDVLPPDVRKPAKGIIMASSLEEMDSWQAYPTYDVYLQMMRRFVERYPDLCHIDTIGRSVQGRLLLALVIDGGSAEGKREMFYSASIHGDELVPYYLMLRLCDTLLRSYGSDADITYLLDHISVCVNPLNNPDGTYFGGDSTVAAAVRYNANGVDLNRNYPDPFGTIALDPLQPENKQQIDYIGNHHFMLSATLHGGAEVLNYPWDSFTSATRANEHDQWWQQVCSRFIERGRQFDAEFFTDVCDEGYIVGGDWYVIRNGRQDYLNFYHGIRELTMEVSVAKMPPSSQLDDSWNALAPSLIGYIGEALNIDVLSVEKITPISIQSMVYPNPTRGVAYIKTSMGIHAFDLSNRAPGIYPLRVDGRVYKIVKL